MGKSMRVLGEGHGVESCGVVVWERMYSTSHRTVLLCRRDFYLLIIIVLNKRVTVLTTSHVFTRISYGILLVHFNILWCLGARRDQLQF